MSTTTLNPLVSKTHKVVYRASEDSATYPTRYNYIVHNDMFCESIPASGGKRARNNTSVAEIFAENEWFDGEILIGNVVECKRCADTVEAPVALPKGEQITDRQIPFLTDLVAKRPNWANERGIGWMTDPEQAKVLLPQMSKSAAKGHISAALAVKPELTTLAPAPTKATRTNNFAQKCLLCKIVVPAKEGILSKADNGKWVVEHIECPNNDWGLTTGYYAVGKDSGEMGFYYVSPNGIMVQAGPQFIPVYASAAESIAARILHNPKEAMLRYGQLIGKCGRCGLALTNEVSRDYGIGPICRGKMGW